MLLDASFIFTPDQLSYAEPEGSGTYAGQMSCSCTMRSWSIQELKPSLPERHYPANIFEVKSLKSW
uniref:Uncharacterized protein n=2 Tax=Anguilla anguilla TaxID=7936 RepID=A0A0E9QMJ6_ANGAN